jgi:hypothetical protein
MLAPVNHILPITTIQRERILPAPGRVLVRKGQKVSPTDVVAEADIAPEHILVEVARALRVPLDQAGKYIHCKEGDVLSEGDILAERAAGFARIICRTPRPGKVIGYRRGQLLLEVEGRPFELKAGISGVVSDLVPEFGAYIEATGALIQGVWGNGRIDSGLLNVQMNAPDDLLTPNQIDVSMRGAIVLGGHCANEEVFQSAEEIPLKGVILASMPARLLPKAQKTTCPVILLDGFGRIPMNDAAFKLLTTNNRREISLNAEITERYHRPEIVIPLPAANDLPPHSDMGAFRPGQKVRIVRWPKMGMVGTLTGIQPTPVVLTNGLYTRAAEVRFDDNQNITLPLANLEILE